MVKATPLFFASLLLTSVTATWIPKRNNWDPAPSADCEDSKKGDEWKGDGWKDDGWKDDGWKGDGWKGDGWKGDGHHDKGGYHGDKGDHHGDKGGYHGHKGGGGDKHGGKGGTTSSIPDIPGPDPNSEALSPALEALVDAVEAAGPWPEEIPFTGDILDGDFTISDAVPFDYCVGENDANGTDVDDGNDTNFAQIGQDYCIDRYGDPELRNGSYFNDTTGDDLGRRHENSKRTFADTGATSTPNRWRRGSVVSICVERNNNFNVNYGGGTFRASWILAQAVNRAIKFWNAGLRLDLVSLEFVENCNDAVYVAQALDQFKNAAETGVLATTPFPPRRNQNGRDRAIHVWKTSYANNFQNVLTGIMSHELGHALGLAHDNCKSISQPCLQITPQVANSILFSTVGAAATQTFTGPEPGDFDGANDFYALAAGPGTEFGITLWPATRGPFITYPPLPKCKWILGVCYY